MSESDATTVHTPVQYIKAKPRPARQNTGISLASTIYRPLNRWDQYREDIVNAITPIYNIFEKYKILVIGLSVTIIIIIATLLGNLIPISVI